MRLLRLIALYFRPAGLDFASGFAGLTGGLIGSRNARNLPSYQGYVPTQTGQADQAWGQALQAIQAATDRNTGMVDPTLLSSYSKLLGIDLSGLVSAGSSAGEMLTNLSGTAGGMGNMAAGQAGAINQSAFDPQNALHDRLQQQVVDNTRAGESARGLAMGPYGAGLENQATTNFNLDWQNNMLGREMAGAGATQGLNQAAMGYYGMQPELTMAGAQLPITAQQTAYGAPMDYAGMFTGAEMGGVIGPQASIEGQVMPYLGTATQAGDMLSNYNLGRALDSNQMQQVAQYGLWGGGQGGAYGMGNTSGFGNPMNWIGMGMGGGGGGMAGPG